MSLPPTETAGSTDKVIFSRELSALAAEFGDRKVTVAEILEATRGRGFNLLLVLISLPFLTPIPLPGFSIPFGIAAALIGARMAMGREPWLPQRLLSHALPPKFLPGLIRAASRVMRWMEYVLRPRAVWVYENAVLRRIAGFGIALSGLYLVLPLPIPFSNSLPATTVLLFAAGALERDAVFYVAGCAALLVSTCFFVALAYGGAEGFLILEHKLRGG